MGDRADGRITGTTKFCKFTYEANLLILQSVPLYVGSRKTLRTMMANTPLVKNLQNDAYMKILLKEKSGLEELFAEIGVIEVRNELKASCGSMEKIPVKLKKIIDKPNFPEMLKKYFFGLKSNGILC